MWWSCSLQTVSEIQCLCKGSSRHHNWPGDERDSFLNSVITELAWKKFTSIWFAVQKSRWQKWCCRRLPRLQGTTHDDADSRLLQKLHTTCRVMWPSCDITQAQSDNHVIWQYLQNAWGNSPPPNMGKRNGAFPKRPRELINTCIACRPFQIEHYVVNTTAMDIVLTCTSNVGVFSVTMAMEWSMYCTRLGVSCFCFRNSPNASDEDSVRETESHMKGASMGKMPNDPMGMYEGVERCPYNRNVCT